MVLIKPCSIISNFDNLTYRDRIGGALPLIRHDEVRAFTIRSERAASARDLTVNLNGLRRARLLQPLQPTQL